MSGVSKAELKFQKDKSREIRLGLDFTALPRARLIVVVGTSIKQVVIFACKYQ